MRGIKQTKESIKETFLSRINKNTSNGCWEYTGSISAKDGYGRIYTGKSTYAHRYAWELFREKIPYGMCVLHHCDNRCCVNPEHLYLGTHKENTKDMINRKRNSPRNCAIKNSKPYAGEIWLIRLEDIVE